MKSAEPDFTSHLGDLYYVGDANEVRENFLEKKRVPILRSNGPRARKAVSR
jgi:hypothetical protein